MILSAFFFNPQGDHRMSWRHPRAAGRATHAGADIDANLVDHCLPCRLDVSGSIASVSIQGGDTLLQLSDGASITLLGVWTHGYI